MKRWDRGWGWVGTSAVTYYDLLEWEHNSLMDWLVAM